MALPVEVQPRPPEQVLEPEVSVDLTPRLQCLRHLAGLSCAELGMSYPDYVRRVRGLMAREGALPRLPVCFRVRAGPIGHKRAAKPRPEHSHARVPTPRRGTAAPASVVVLDDDVVEAPGGAAAMAEVTQGPAEGVTEAASEELERPPASAVLPLDTAVTQPVSAAEPGPTSGAAEASAAEALEPPASEVEASTHIATPASLTVGDPYASPSAPVALLRAYATGGRWIGLRQGCVVFEDDAVQYPAATLTPVREHQQGGALLSLVSLWLLVALGDRYETGSTQDVCARHGCARLSEGCAQSLLAFLRGERKECELLVPPERLRIVPSPAPSRLRAKPRAVGQPPPLAAAELRLPGEDEAAPGEQLAESFRAVAETRAALRQNEMEEAAMVRLMAKLQAELEATDRELAKLSRERERLGEEYNTELAIARNAAKRRRLNGSARVEPGCCPPEDVIARFLVALDAASAQQTKRPLAPAE